MTVDIAGQYAAIEIRKVVFAPGYGDIIIPNGAGIGPLLTADLRDRLEAVQQEYDAAYEACVENLAPATDPKVREKGYNRLQLAQDAYLEIGSEIDSWLSDNAVTLTADMVDANRQDRVRALALVRQAADILDGVEVRRRATGFLRTPHKRYAVSSRPKPIPEVEKLTALLERQVATEPEYVKVSQAEYNRLQSEGQDTTGYRVQHNAPLAAGRPS